MGFLDILVVALVPVLKVLIVTGLGCLLAMERIDLLGPTSRHHLNNLVFYVFSPALVAGNLAEAVTWNSLKTLWFMPVNILLTFIFGSILAWILIKITNPPERLRGLIIGCCAAGNLGNLLLIIIPAVCEESNSPFGDSSDCSTNGEAYASLSMAIGAVYIWTICIILMQLYAPEQEELANGSQTFPETYTEALLPSTLNRFKSSSSSSIEGEKESFMKRRWQSFKNIMGKIDWKMVFTPSTIAAIVGFTIGLISPLKKLIVDESGALYVIESATTLVGDAMIPSMTLIVGANLLKGLKSSGVGLKVILGIIIVRNVLLPLIGVGVVKGAVHLGMIDSDKLYQFVILLQYAVPPAMTIGIIVQLMQMGESECSLIMLWTYAVAAVSLTLWSTVYLWMLQS